MMKVLNHFKNKYYVLHDTDVQTCLSKRKNNELSVDGALVYDSFIMVNPAWTNNTKISDQMGDDSRVIASVINFEDAYFSETISSDKPENCINNLRTDEAKYQLIKKLLDGILEVDEVDLPPGAIAWQDITELADAVTLRLNSVTVLDPQ
jgi:putative ATP-dependent endonuclease of OLD family